MIVVLGETSSRRISLNVEIECDGWGWKKKEEEEMVQAK